MFDILYKYSRKVMSPQLYKKLQLSFLGRLRTWDTINTYKSIFEQYKKNTPFELRDKVVVEIGTGPQLFTALYFLQHGAKQVIVVDPKISEDWYKEQLCSFLDKFREQNPAFSLSADDVKSKIVVESDLNQIDRSYEGNIDLLVSHLVLEHFDSLPTFFRNLQRLLAINGVSYNLVDLTDHTYHPFGKFKLFEKIPVSRSFFHLRYSDTKFRYLNDSKCYMNRKLLPVYIEMAQEYGFVAEIDNRVFALKAKIHKDVMNSFKSRDNKDIHTASFSISLQRKP